MAKRTRRRSRHANLSDKTPEYTEDTLVDIVDEQPSPFLLVLDGVQDPHNLGACLRGADGAGVHAVVAPKDRAVALTHVVRVVASGAAEHVPFVQVTNLARTLRYLKEQRIFVVGASDAAERSLFDLDLDRPLALVMGAEGEGLRRLTSETCDVLARIPMQGHVSCLNVSVAAGVYLFEALRQRLPGTPVAKTHTTLKLKVR